MIRRKGGSRFKKRRNHKYMNYLDIELLAGTECDGECGRWATDKAHLDDKGTGGYDAGNVALLCRWCHIESEKRVDKWIAERGVDLRAKAVQRWETYQNAQKGA